MLAVEHLACYSVAGCLDFRDYMHKDSINFAQKGDYSTETSALSAPGERAACNCRAGGRAMKGASRGQTQTGKGCIPLVDMMCS